MREANHIIYKLMCEEQHMHNERVLNIEHGLVHHSFAAELLWTCTSTAQLRENTLHYSLGCSSLRIEYHYRNALALITSLNNKAKHGRLTKTLLNSATKNCGTRPLGTSVSNTEIPSKAITIYVESTVVRQHP